jgi:hypothetical protein
MSLAELEKLHSLLQDARSPEAVFPALRDERAVEPKEGEKPNPAVSAALERQYVQLSQIASPERYVGDPIAQDTARHVLARLYDLHQQALDMLGIFDSMASDDSRLAISTISTRSPA